MPASDTSDWEIVKKYESDYVKTAYDGERLAYTKSLTELAFAVAGQPPQEKTWSCQHRIACLDFSPTSSELAILAEKPFAVLNLMDGTESLLMYNPSGLMIEASHSVETASGWQLLTDGERFWNGHRDVRAAA